MQTFKKNISILLITFTCLLALNSCEEAWWGRSYYLDGEWRVVEVQGYSNYEPGDSWFFYSSGDFYALGAGNLQERGVWERQGRMLYIAFNSYEPEIEGYIRTYEGDYLVLDINDYTYGTRYTLRLVREQAYSAKKEE